MSNQSSNPESVSEADVREAARRKVEAAPESLRLDLLTAIQSMGRAVENEPGGVQRILVDFIAPSRTVQR